MAKERSKKFARPVQNSLRNRESLVRSILLLRDLLSILRDRRSTTYFWLTTTTTNVDPCQLHAHFSIDNHRDFPMVDVISDGDGVGEKIEREGKRSGKTGISRKNRS